MNLSTTAQASQAQTPFSSDLSFAREMDEQDPLKDFRSRFFIPQHKGKDTIYFTGNSLGLQPKSTAAYIQQELDDWAQWGVEGHFRAKNPWVSYHEPFAPLIAKIVGAKESEVVVMNQLTVNLHLLLASFYRPTPDRYKIICEAKAFPSDQYALQSQIAWHGLNTADALIEVAPREGEHTIRQEDIEAAIELHSSSIALVLFGGVNYYSGQVFDMAAITRAAHSVGAYAGFDLAHAAGNVALQLHDWNVDFACWCSYKYLNSGPGGVSGVFIHERHVTNTTLPRLAGWWGTNKEKRFLMEPQFEPIPTAEGWQLSNAPVLSMAAHKASLNIFEEAGMHALSAKSKRQTGYLFFLLNELNKESDRPYLQAITPEDAHGCQVSLLMKERGKEVFDALTQQGVVVDWREPNVIRVAPVPLYNRFEDVWQFARVMREVLTVGQ
jgi:kynureninase